MVFTRLHLRRRARHRQMAARAHQRQGARRAAGDRTIEAGVKGGRVGWAKARRAEDECGHGLSCALPTLSGLARLTAWAKSREASRNRHRLRQATLPTRRATTSKTHDRTRVWEKA